MTDPNPASVAPETDPAQPAAPDTGTSTTSTTDPAPFDPSSLSPEAKRWLDEQIAAADKKSRTTSKANAAAEAEQRLRAEFAQKLGLAGEGDEAPSAEELTSHLEAARADAYKAGVETQLYRLEKRLGFDAEAMLDSNRAMEDLISALDETEGAGDLVPGSREFAAALEVAAAKVLERNPRLKSGPSGPRPDPSQGARGQGPSGLDAQIAQAEANGDIRTSIRLKLQREKQQNKA